MDLYCVLCLFFGSILSILFGFLYLIKNDFRIHYLDLKKFRKGYSPKEVEKHYEDYDNDYSDNYGKIIQAHRTKDEGELIDYLIKSGRLENGQTILDAGCGFGGPSTMIAEKLLDVKVKGLTISETQAKKAGQLIKEKNLEHRVEIQKGDYHLIDKYFEPETFDRIIFLESIGHATDFEKVILAAKKALKPGGLIYIKDYCKREIPEGTYKKIHKEGLKKMDELYRFNTLDIYHTIYILRKNGFGLVEIKEPDFETDDYDVNRNFTLNSGIRVVDMKYQKVEWKYKYPPIVDPIEFLFEKVTYSIKWFNSQK